MRVICDGDFGFLNCSCLFALFRIGTSSRSFAKAIEMWNEETVLNVCFLDQWP